jgi:hypothetical protein
MQRTFISGASDIDTKKRNRNLHLLHDVETGRLLAAIVANDVLPLKAIFV